MAKINIKGPIVDNDTNTLYSWFGLESCSPGSVAEQLKNIDPDEDITVEINSGGGLCVSGFEIYEMLKSRKAKVTANVIYAASAASVIACGADKTLMGDAAIMMIHNASSALSGNKRDHTAEAKALNEYDKSIINVYMKKTKKTSEELQRLMDKDTWMSPQTAIDLGFADGWIHEDESPTEIQAVASEISIIPHDRVMEMLAKIKDIEHKAENGGDAFLNIETNNMYENGGNDMTLDEFLAANPEAQKELDSMVNDQVNERVDAALAEVVDAAKKEAVDNENNRLKELDEIAGNVTDEALAEAKYGEGRCTAKDLAYQAMKENKLRMDKYMTDAMADANDADDIGAAPEDEEFDNSGAMMAQYVNEKEGK